MKATTLDFVNPKERVLLGMVEHGLDTCSKNDVIPIKIFVI